jgi:peptidoglycan LD-endopeptidase CwlK
MTTPHRDKGLLYPAFADLLRDFEERLVGARLPFQLFMGLRTFGEQDALYAQGRTMPGKIVTNARGGESWHNYGLASDFVLNLAAEKPTAQWSWNTKADMNADGRKDWIQMGELAEACGLEWGGRFKNLVDLPHVQHRFGLTLVEAMELYRRGGLNEVWRAAGA